MLLGEGERTEPITIAGRLMVKRLHGGSTFADLRDGAGRIQLMARRDALGEERYEAFGDLDSGDIIGIEGAVFRTRRGEVSVEVEDFRLLAKSLQPLPEKWHGLKDVELRYRQRHLDLISNPESKAVFELRSRVISGIRRFLDARGFLEVETPVLHSIAGGGLAKPFKTHHNALDRDLYLRIALELHLKRLVVGGFDKVYEISRVFRNEGLSPRHNPEFTMFESYEAYKDYRGVMDYAEEVIQAAAEAGGKPLDLEYQGEPFSLRPPFRRARMVDLIGEHAGIDVLANPEAEALAEIARASGVPIPPGTPWGFVVNELYEKKVEMALRQPTIVYDYPLDVSPLARRLDEDPRFVERFETVIMGRELTNAFTELIDPIDQLARFEAQAAAAAFADDTHPIDMDYVEALESGMPPTGGFGMGIDRLVMLLADRASIRDVVLFPALRNK
jgi:lysyl-tRNA synthetase class 2